MATRPLAAGVLILGVVFAGSAHAGGGKADYARAARLAKEVRGKVLGERLRAVWVGEDSVVFRRDVAPGRWRFTLAGPGGVRDAFDHERAARELARFVPTGASADALPLRPVYHEAGELVATNAARFLGLDLATGAVRERDPETLTRLRLEPSTQRRSRDRGRRDTSVVFVNRSGGEIRLVWLDRRGGRKAYGTVIDGERRSQHTFPGHVWQVERTDGKRLGRYVARATPGVVLVGETVVDVDARELRETSPHPTLRAIVREHDVFLRHKDTDEERRLTTDGTEANRYGPPWEWSPDGRYLAVMRTRPAQKRTVHMVESSPADRVQPRLVSHDYLKPGDRIAHSVPHVFHVASGKRVEFGDALFPTPWSLSRLSWSADSRRLRFLYNQRGHQVLRLIEVAVPSGRVRALIDETSKTFIDYSQKTTLIELPASGDWLWASERSGWNHLYRVDGRTGERAALTSGPWVVRNVIRADEEAGTVLFRAMGVFPDQSPYHVHVGRVRLGGGDVTWLTEADGTHEVRFSPASTHYVDTYSRADLPPVHELRRASDGQLVCEIARADDTALRATGWRPPVRFRSQGRDGETDIWGLLHLPTTHDGKARIPVVEAIYAGPHGHHVPTSWRPWTGPRELAELGFAVVQIDGMGTNWRSKAFHDVCWQNLADAGFADRIAWIRALAEEHPFLDLDRVGIYGGSAGGQNALRGLLAHGDFYGVGVADCGCHDNRMDKIWWNEAWMGWPVGPHYEEQSNVTQAHRLTGKLLLIVGELDRNVDPASTMQVVNALVRADKDFDLLVLPGVGHGAAGTPYGKRRQLDFLVRHLLGVEPRWE